jgi:hypothetical protein
VGSDVLLFQGAVHAAAGHYNLFPASFITYLNAPFPRRPRMYFFSLGRDSNPGAPVPAVARAMMMSSNIMIDKNIIRFKGKNHINKKRDRITGWNNVRHS